MKDQNLDAQQSVLFSSGIADAIVGITIGPEEAAALITLMLARIGDQTLKQGEPIETVLDLYDSTIDKLQMLRDTATDVEAFLRLIQKVEAKDGDLGESSDGRDQEPVGTPGG